jgi:hypothetical protein
MVVGFAGAEKKRLCWAFVLLYHCVHTQINKQTHVVVNLFSHLPRLAVTGHFRCAVRQRVDADRKLTIWGVNIGSASTDARQMVEQGDIKPGT